MENRIPEGTEVLIFRYVGSMGPYQDNFHFKKGIIESCMEIEELTYTRDLPKKRFFYTVLGEDGKRYRGNYGTGNIGSNFFRTAEDYDTFLANELQRLEEQKGLIERQMDHYEEIRSRIPKKEPKAPEFTKK